MSKRIILKKLTQKVVPSKGTSLAATSTPDTKWIVIQEKCPRDEALDVTPGEMGSKEKEVMPPPKAKKAHSMPSKVAIIEVTQPVAPGKALLPILLFPWGPKSLY